MAGAPARVEVEGDRELRRAFKRLEGRLDSLREVHRDAGEEVVQEARTLVPVLTGALRDTLRLSIRLANSAAGGTSVLAGKGSVPYAGPIHFGWRARNIEPQPFLYDALDRRRDDVLRTYSDGVDGLVRRFDREAPR